MSNTENDKQLTEIEGADDDSQYQDERADDDSQHQDERSEVERTDKEVASVLIFEIPVWAFV